MRQGHQKCSRVKTFRLHQDYLDDQAAAHNLAKAHLTWHRIHQVLHSDSCTAKVRSYFYKTVVMSILLCRSETWVVSRRMLGRLNAFHHRATHCITKRHIRQLPNGKCEHPPTEEVLEVGKMSPLKERRGYCKLMRVLTVGFTANVCRQLRQTTVILCGGVNLRLVLVNNRSQAQSSH